MNSHGISQFEVDPSSSSSDEEIESPQPIKQVEKAEPIPEEIGSKPKKLPKILINTSKGRSEVKLIKILCEKYKNFGWAISNNYNSNVFWAGVDLPYEDYSIATEMYLNRLPGMKMIAHKKETSFYLNKFREYFPDDFDFFPRTFLIPEELNKFEAHLKQNPDRLYIAKPTSGSHGDGIVLVRKMKDLPMSQFNYSSHDMVVQEYIDKPLLIDGKKFDLRLYVLIASVKPMIAFLCDEGLARFCTEDYQAPTNENLKNYYMHLTNYNLNKLSPKYKYTEECQEINDGSKRTLTSLWKSIEKAGYSKETIMDNIKDLVQQLLVGLQPVTQFCYNAAFEGKDNGKCFQVIGIDVLIDENLKPWLLEINGNPSMNIEHEFDQPTDKKKPETVISPVDRYVKEKVMEDSLLLPRKKPAKLAEIDRFGSFEKIYNSEDSQYQEKQVFKDVLDIFGKLSGTRFKNALNSGRFAKLGYISGMTNDKLTKPDYDLIFKKAVHESEDKQMNFQTFIRAIEMVSEKLCKDYDPEDKRPSVEFLISTVKEKI